MVSKNACQRAELDRALSTCTAAADVHFVDDQVTIGFEIVLDK